MRARDSVPYRRLAAVGAAVAALSLAVAACGGGGGTVKVALQEWAVTPDPTSVSAGKVTFEASNNGPEDKHELVVFKTDLAPRDLPTKEDGSVDEEGAGLELIGEIEEFDTGSTESASFDLEAGSYVLICNIVQTEADGTVESHYKLGMSTALEVK